MDTIEFFGRVLPDTGYYVATVINPDRRAQKSYETIDALANAVIRIDIAGGNVYYAMSSFIEAGNRKQVNVELTKSLFIDVDCGEGKPFADQREGAKALKVFLKASGLPPPMIVNSGRGLHVYWPLTEALAPTDWQPLADALKECAKHHDFQIDAAVTADSARVLRPMGTHGRAGQHPRQHAVSSGPVPAQGARQARVRRSGQTGVQHHGSTCVRHGV